MKAKCPICTTTRGKRDCLLQGGDLICPRCCAQTRSSETCADCRHFKKAEQVKIDSLIKNDALDSLIEVDPELEDLVERTLQQIENGQLTKAESTLIPLLEKHPRNHMVQLAMGCHHAFQRRYQESIPYFEKAVEIFPQFLVGWHNLGMSYRKIANIQGSIECSRKVVSLGHPEAPEIIDNRKFIHDFAKTIRERYHLTLEEYFANAATYEQAFQDMEEGRLAAAIRGFHSVLETEPTHHQSYGNLGLCHAMRGEKQEALDSLDKALELDPNYKVASQNKPLVEALQEGQKLDLPMKTVNYGISGVEDIPS